MRILSVDVGTSAIKATLWRGQRQGKARRQPVVSRWDGVKAEIPARRLLADIERTVAAAAGRQPVDVISLGVFSAAPMVCDRDGRVRVDIITHADRRSVEEARQIEREIGAQRVLRLSGNRPVPGGIGSSTLRWLHRHQPQALGQGAQVGQASSYILRHWTGQWVIDPSQAVFLGLLQIATQRWSAELCRACGVPVSALPELQFADTVMGHLTPAAAQRLGLKSGTPVVGGLVDTGAAVIAAGLTPGQLLHSAGSTDVQALVLEQPCPGPTWLTRPLGTGGTLPQRWLAVSTIAASGSALQWAHRALFGQLNAVQFDALVRRICRRPISGGVGFSPYLAGDRTSIEQSRACISGLTLAATPPQILSAMIEGLVAASADRFAQLRALHPVRSTIATTGRAGALGDAMHRAWSKSGRWDFVRLGNANLLGLRLLAQSALQRPTKTGAPA